MRIILTVLAMMIATQTYAGVSYNKDTRSMEISGPTTQGQVIKASNILRENEVDRIYMWGPGGYFDMAIHLGNQIRKEGVKEVIVPKNKACISACALIALGADTISVDGKLMFHRPYFPFVPTMDSIENINSKAGVGYIRLARYVEDMGYKRRLTDDMMLYTTPCKFIMWEDVQIKNRVTPYWTMEDWCK